MMWQLASPRTSDPIQREDGEMPSVFDNLPWK